MNWKMERLVWVAKNSFLIIGVAVWLLIPSYSTDLLLLLHRYSFLIPFALWLWLYIKEAAGSNGIVVVPQAAPAPPVASFVENFYDYLFFNPQEEEQQQREYCDVDEPSWLLNEPVLVGKESAAEFSWDGVVDSTAWKGAGVSPSAPPIATAYSASLFPFEEFCGPPLPTKEEKGRSRRRVKEEEASGRWKREVPAVKKDELFRRVDAFMNKQRHIFEFDLQGEEDSVRRPRLAMELDWRHEIPQP